jgi:hypothetical protein
LNGALLSLCLCERTWTCPAGLLAVTGLRWWRR